MNISGPVYSSYVFMLLWLLEKEERVSSYNCIFKNSTQVIIAIIS